MAQVLQPLAGMFSDVENDNLLIGLDISDDAAVYKISKDKAVILTVDFFPPVVDDPYSYGAVAAVNAMSDVYAMGGEVAVALNICAFPGDMEDAVISEILRGGAEQVKRAGGILAGGHTVDDKEPKYGLSVMGFAHPDAIMTKGGARPGDVLILTKALGTGIITTAGKKQKAEPAHLDAALGSMMQLSQTASQILVQEKIKCCTDVTGFAVLGHGLEIAEKSGVGLHLSASALPFLPGSWDYAVAGFFPGGTGKNKAALQNDIHFSESVGEETRLLLYTPETSGGLLAAIPPSKIEKILAEFEAKGAFCRVIGEVVEGQGIEVGP